MRREQLVLHDLNKQVPKLMLFKCGCHSIDKCAEHAFSSAKRWDEYVQYYKVRDAISVHAAKYSTEISASHVKFLSTDYSRQEVPS